MTWYVAHIETARLKTVLRGLSEAHIEHYTPMERFSRNTRRGWVDHTKPLLPSYVFAHTPDWPSVKRVDGVVRIVGFPDAQPLSEAAVERLYAIREAEAAGVFDRTRKGGAFKPGQRVRIVAGPFKDMIGEIIKYKGGRRVAVAMKALGVWSKGSAEVDVKALEAA